jgi:hypothetical protein
MVPSTSALAAAIMRPLALDLLDLYDMAARSRRSARPTPITTSDRDSGSLVAALIAAHSLVSG